MRPSLHSKHGQNSTSSWHCGSCRRQHANHAPSLRYNDSLHTKKYIFHDYSPLRRASFENSLIVPRVFTPDRVDSSTSNEVLESEIKRLAAILDELVRCKSVDEKIKFLWRVPSVHLFFETSLGEALLREMRSMDKMSFYVLLTLPALGQEHVLSAFPAQVSVAQGLQQLARGLEDVEFFYQPIGGLLGYQYQTLVMLGQGRDEEEKEDKMKASPSHDDASSSSSISFHIPPGLDLSRPQNAHLALHLALVGLVSLPQLAELYPLGGAGDRLGLVDPTTGTPLPTALLPYAGHTLLDHLVTNVQAREYLYYHLFATQVTTPLVMMTSHVKRNDAIVKQFLSNRAWYGRHDAIRTVRQPLVPVVNVASGKWLLPSPLAPLTKPGGHGVLWKLLLDEQIYPWLEQTHQRSAALIRQISNPLAGLDTTLLALAGMGLGGGYHFGFASCDRAVGAAEGVNVMVERAKKSRERGVEYEYSITNIEYTEFARLGIRDVAEDDTTSSSSSSSPCSSPRSVYPANTNVLFANLAATRQAVEASVAASQERLQSHSHASSSSSSHHHHDASSTTTGAMLPGLIFNRGKKAVAVRDALTGEEELVVAGRLESTMQNIADCLTTTTRDQLSRDRILASMHPDASSSSSSSSPSPSSPLLPTFVLFNERRKVTSSAKRQLPPNSTRIAQTPPGSFYDLLTNHVDLLTNHCGFSTPSVGSVEEYLAKGPRCVVRLHPALGPLWTVVGQKLRHGTLHEQSELVLEVAEACLRHVSIQGSLVVEAECIMGHWEGEVGMEGISSADGVLRSMPFSMDSIEADLRHGGADTIDNAPPATTTSSLSSSSSPTASRLVYSDRVGRIRLENVCIENRGIDYDSNENVWWQHAVQRTESLHIKLLGRSELDARGVTIRGQVDWVVPDGWRWIVRPDASLPEGYLVHRERLREGGGGSWRWEYQLCDKEGRIVTDSIKENGAVPMGTSIQLQVVDAGGDL